MLAANGETGQAHADECQSRRFWHWDKKEGVLITIGKRPPTMSPASSMRVARLAPVRATAANFGCRSVTLCELGRADAREVGLFASSNGFALRRTR
jgi:hypothetical protein